MPPTDLLTSPADLVLMVFSIAPLAAVLAPLIAWLMWLQRTRPRLRGFRAKMTGCGLVSGSLNAAMFAGWLSWRLAGGDAPNGNVWAAKEALSNISLLLSVVALTAAVVGDGRERLLIGIAGLATTMVWIPIAFL
jgi:hypothetical protein